MPRRPQPAPHAHVERGRRQHAIACSSAGGVSGSDAEKEFLTTQILLQAPSEQVLRPPPAYNARDCLMDIEG